MAGITFCQLRSFESGQKKPIGCQGAAQNKSPYLFSMHKSWYRPKKSPVCPEVPVDICLKSSFKNTFERETDTSHFLERKCHHIIKYLRMFKMGGGEGDTQKGPLIRYPDTRMN